MFPAFLAGVASVFVTAQAVHSFTSSPKSAGNRKAYLDYAKKTLTARGSHKLTPDEVEEAAQINKDIKRLTRTVKEGWDSEGDKAAFERVLAYVPVTRAKIIAEKGLSAVDSGIQSVIDILNEVRPSGRK